MPRCIENAIMTDKKLWPRKTKTDLALAQEIYVTLADSVPGLDLNARLRFETRSERVRFWSWR